MNNIFENAYFGKAYKTKDGNKVILVTLLDNVAYLLIEYKIGNTSLFGNDIHDYRLDGICKQYQNLDIVSEWKQEVNEEELDELTNTATKELYSVFEHTKNIWQSGFKEGCRKVLEYLSNTKK